MSRALGVAIVCARLAGVACAHGTPDEMAAALDREIAARPADPWPHVRRAMIEVESGAWQQSLADLELASRKGAQREDLDVLRARALIAGRRLPSAQAILDDFISSHPRHAAALLVRAGVMRELQRPADAVADYRSALSGMETAEPDLYVEMSALLAGQNQIDEALKVLERGMAARGRIPSLAVKALELETAAGRFDDALRRIESMRQQSSRPEPWMAKRAALLSLAGRADEARAAWLELQGHIAALPDGERGSHAMSMIAIQAAEALKAPGPSAASTSRPNPSPP